MDNFYQIADKKITAQNARSSKPSFLDFADSILGNLSERSQKIMKIRFGLAADKGETLERIGERYHITRERVRQIISESGKKIAKNSKSDNFKKAEEILIFTINRNNGIIKEPDILNKFDLGGAREVNAVKFFANCSGNVFEIEEKGIFEKSLVASLDTAEKVKKVILDAEGVFKSRKHPLTDNEIVRTLIKLNPDLSRAKVSSYLAISSKVKKNQFGRWGMSDWMEISPKGTKEKVYLILKETGKPLHFTKIAELIDRYNLGKRKAHPQTVHNELIKDDRFILIGRGIYALGEWGYFEGTIKDVLKTILEKSVRPLNRNEITEEVLKVRKVKKTTIAINLNNPKLFLRQKDFYTVKK